MRRLLALVIDLAPGWIWREGNLRFIGSHTVHFCYEDGRRTVEFDGRTVGIGNRVRH